MKGKIDQKEKRKKRGRKVSESGSARVVDGSRRSETVGDLTGGYEPGACRPEVTSHPRGSECAYRMCGIGSPSEPSTSHSQFLHIAASSHIASHRVYTRTHRRGARTSPPSSPPPPAFERATSGPPRFFDKFHPPAPDRDRLCNETRTRSSSFFSPFLFSFVSSFFCIFEDNKVTSMIYRSTIRE